MKRRSKPVATDTVCSDTPSEDYGSACAQMFAGTKVFITDVYGIKKDK